MYTAFVDLQFAIISGLFTGAVAMSFSIPIELDFIAEHPFYYVIADQKDYNPLFSGRLVEV